MASTGGRRCQGRLTPDLTRAFFQLSMPCSSRGGLACPVRVNALARFPGAMLPEAVKCCQIRGMVVKDGPWKQPTRTSCNDKRARDVNAVGVRRRKFTACDSGAVANDAFAQRRDEGHRREMFNGVTLLWSLDSLASRPCHLLRHLSCQPAGSAG